MYRIKKDKRVLRSSKLICDGLNQILLTKKFEQINVSELTEASGVSRGTFYRIFDSPIDVLAYMCDSLVEEAEDEFLKRRSNSRDELTLFFLSFWMEHCFLLESIQRSGKTELAVKAMRKRPELYKIEGGRALTDSEAEFYGSTFAGAMSGLLSVWTQHGCKQNVIEMFNIFKKVVDILHQ